jgi:hypothetical protein
MNWGTNSDERRTINRSAPRSLQSEFPIRRIQSHTLPKRPPQAGTVRRRQDRDFQHSRIIRDAGFEDVAEGSVLDEKIGAVQDCVVEWWNADLLH